MQGKGRTAETYFHTKLKTTKPLTPRTEPTQSIFSSLLTGVSFGNMIAKLPNTSVPSSVLQSYKSASSHQKRARTLLT